VADKIVSVVVEAEAEAKAVAVPIKIDRCKPTKVATGPKGVRRAKVADHVKAEAVAAADVVADVIVADRRFPALYKQS
jgi:hypothetical protein